MNVNIRPLQEKDAYTSVKWRNIPEIWTYTEFVANKEITIEDELNWIRKVMADPTCRRFAILADDTYVGNIYLTDIKDQTAEYHIFIGDKTYWGKGIAKEASRLLFAFARQTLHLTKINLRVKTENAPAYAVYQKLGFQKIGRSGEFTTMSLGLES